MKMSKVPFPDQKEVPLSFPSTTATTINMRDYAEDEENGEVADPTMTTSPEMHRIDIGSMDDPMPRTKQAWYRHMFGEPSITHERDNHDIYPRMRGISPYAYAGDRWWSVHYFFDWILILVVVFTELAITHLVLGPYDRYLPLDDPSLNYPLLDDIVPAWTLAFIAGLGPVVVFLIMQLFTRSSHDFHNACLGLVQALVFTLIFTDAIKFAAGRYRPDWHARVAANSSSAVLTDGRESFPSGHSSISFAAMTFLSLYLAGKLGIYRRHGGATWKAVIVLFPIAVATFVAVSRVRDYHHHFSDILGGSLLGAGMGIMAYFMNYHSIASDNSHIPKLRVDRRLLYTHPIPTEYRQ